MPISLFKLDASGGEPQELLRSDNGRMGFREEIEFPTFSYVEGDILKVARKPRSTKAKYFGVCVDGRFVEVETREKFKTVFHDMSYGALDTFWTRHSYPYPMATMAWLSGYANEVYEALDACVVTEPRKQEITKMERRLLERLKNRTLLKCHHSISSYDLRDLIECGRIHISQIAEQLVSRISLSRLATGIVRANKVE